MMRASAAAFTASGLKLLLQFRLSTANSNALETPCRDVQQRGSRPCFGPGGAPEDRRMAFSGVI
jgi:hypothetical protein